MTRTILASLIATVIVATSFGNASAETRCRMEQQCRWVNFKKVCHYVKVCRES